MKNILHIMDGSFTPCLESGTSHVLQVTNDDRGIIDAVVIMLESQHLADKLGIINAGCQGWPMSSVFIKFPQISDDEGKVTDTFLILPLLHVSG